MFSTLSDQFLNGLKTLLLFFKAIEKTQFLNFSHTENPILKLFPHSISDLSSSDVVVDHKLNAHQIAVVVFDNVESILGKGKKKNTGYQHFLFFPQCFQKFLFSIKESKMW